MDRLDTLLARFSVSASLFQAGLLCGVNSTPQLPHSGYLHVIRKGTVTVRHKRHRALKITEPSLLFYPHGMAHQLVTDSKLGAEMACATVTFNAGRINPISAALPPVIVIPYAGLSDLTAALDLLFHEAFNNFCGRKGSVDRLFEVVLIHILRVAIGEGATSTGMLAGLSHPQLARAIVAIHERPSETISLTDLAEIAGMSRTAFANTFKTIVGITPGSYFSNWRIALAQDMMSRGLPLKHICTEVGFGSQVALSRAFKTAVGISPRDWLLSRKPSESAKRRMATAPAAIKQLLFNVPTVEGHPTQRVKPCP